MCCSGNDSIVKGATKWNSNGQSLNSITSRPASEQKKAWPRHSDTQALVEQWKDKGHRLVLEGLIVWLSDDDRGQRFIPAGEMERLWDALDEALKLLDDPHIPYQQATPHQRPLFNQALFEALFVREEDIDGAEPAPWVTRCIASPDRLWAARRAAKTALAPFFGARVAIRPKWCAVRDSNPPHRIKSGLEGGHLRCDPSNHGL
jgi:hypothetical protein